MLSPWQLYSLDAGYIYDVCVLRVRVYIHTVEPVYNMDTVGVLVKCPVLWVRVCCIIVTARERLVGMQLVCTLRLGV